MTVRELIEKLRAFPGEAPVVTDNIGFTKLEDLRDPELDHGVRLAGGEISSGRPDEKGAFAFVYFPAPGA